LALFKLGRYGIGIAPVVEPGEPERVIGILSLRDIANGLARLRGSADDARPSQPNPPA
jgi:CBS domain-containing protein